MRISRKNYLQFSFNVYSAYLECEILLNRTLILSQRNKLDNFQRLNNQLIRQMGFNHLVDKFNDVR